MDQALAEKLNQSLNFEFYSAYKYFAMATYFYEINLKGFGKYMFKQAKEEMSHARKLYEELLLRNQKITLSNVEATDSTWINTQNVFEEALAHEKQVSQHYHHFYEHAGNVNDHALKLFLEWFITEQVEEEATFNEMLEAVKAAQGCSCGIAQLDRHLLASAE